MPTQLPLITKGWTRIFVLLTGILISRRLVLDWIRPKSPEARMLARSLGERCPVSRIISISGPCISTRSLVKVWARKR